MSKGALVCARQIRHSDFVIPSDFVIRHSDLGSAVHGKFLIWPAWFCTQEMNGWPILLEYQWADG